MIVWQDLAQEVDLQGLRSLLVDGLALQALLSINNRVFGQALTTMDLYSSSHHTTAGNSDTGAHIALALEDVLIANLGRFHLAADFKDIVSANAQDIVDIPNGARLQAVSYGGIFLYDAILPNYYGTCVGDNGGTRMNHTARREGDVTAQAALLADHRLG